MLMIYLIGFIFQLHAQDKDSEDDFSKMPLEGVKKLFSNCRPIALEQSWRAIPEKSFQPASVRIAWKDRTLWILAELKDKDIYSLATESNQHMRELGDCFEIFLKYQNNPQYIEFHIAPNNLKLQLRYPAEGAILNGMDSSFYIPEPIFFSRVWVEREKNTWTILANIDMLVLGINSSELEDVDIQFSFCRYDYTHNSVNPVVSSTSALSVLNFHSIGNWRLMHCKNMKGGTNNDN